MKSVNKKLLIFLPVFIGGILSIVANNVYVYRNDNVFNQFSTCDSTVISHKYHDAGVSLCNDRDTIPVEVIDSIVIRRIDIPVLRFTFPDHPELSWVKDKENYISAVLDIDGNGMTESADSLQLSVKGRGNSSWWFPKKPMRLKFSKKISICGFAKAKSYVLLADCVDPTLMHNATALWLAQQMGVDYVNSFMPCHVYVNGKYAGAYLLTEKISINKASVDIDDSKGVLIEMSNEYDEEYKFHSALYEMPVMIKDPDLSEIAAEYPDYLAGFSMSEEPKEPEGAEGMEEPEEAEEAEETEDDGGEEVTAEDILRAWEYDFNQAESKAALLEGAEAFDMLSFVNYMLVNDLVLNNEIGHPKSCYIYKEGLGLEYKYKFGPVWDFDLSFNAVAKNGTQEVNIPYDGYLWLNPLFEKLVNSPEFMPLFQERWQYFMDEVYPSLFEWMDSYNAMIEPLAKMNAMRWPQPHSNQWITAKYNTYDNKTRLAEIKNWLHKRIRHIYKATREGVFSK
ncbi:MAG: CotH kinase family protein [Muribaculaceae bacterium]|nr:CotH kinase family protein [Muribaculaceae bacterium]